MYANETQGNMNPQAIGMKVQAAYAASLPPSLPPYAPGIVDMTAGAHDAFEVLSQSLGDLMAKVSPLVEPYPEPGCAVGNQNQSCEASAITNLRLLIERINDKTAEVQRLTAALRV